MAAHSLESLSARVEAHDKEIAGLRDWRHKMANEMIAPIQVQLLDVKLTLNTYEQYFQTLKAGMADLQTARTSKLGRAEFYRLATAVGVGGGAVWALVQWLKP